MQWLGIEQISVFCLPPVDYVTLAADLGCNGISLALEGMGHNAGYPPYSLRDDPLLRRETRTALRDRGIALSIGEGLLLRPGLDPRDLAADMDMLAEMGCERINSLSVDRRADPSRLFDDFALFAQMVADRGMTATVEIVPMLPIGSLAVAQTLLAHVNRPDFRLVLDMMHLHRLAISPEAIAALDPGQIGHVQLCDIADTLPPEAYMDAALHERLTPGDGDVPIDAYLAALPKGLTYGLEVPQRARANAGIGPHDRLRPVVAAARHLLDGD